MLSFADWIDAVRYRLRLVGAVTAVILLGAIIYLLAAPRVYRASSALIVDTRADPLKTANSDDSQANTRSIIATQADLIRSPSVSSLAVTNARLDRDRALFLEWRKQTNGRSPFGAWLQKRVSDQLTVIPGKDSNVLTMQVEAASPDEAARVANGFARAAVEAQYRLRTGPANTYSEWLTQRLAAVKAEVIQSQKALSDFASARGIVDDGDVSAEGTQLAQVETQLAAAQARAAAASGSSYSAPQSRGDAEKSDTVQALRRQVAEASAKFANLRSTFGPDYPDVKSAQAELSTLRSSLNRALSTSVSTFDAARSAQAASDRDAARASEQQLRSVAARQRSRVETIGANLAQYQRLKNEFTVAQKNYSDINDRLERMRLQGSIPQTEVQVLDLAAVPLLPSSPRVPLVLLLASLLGLLVGAALAIMVEALDPRVRGRGAVERLLGAPVIGTLRLPSRGTDGPRLLTGPA